MRYRINSTEYSHDIGDSKEPKNRITNTDREPETFDSDAKTNSRDKQVSMFGNKKELFSQMTYDEFVEAERASKDKPGQRK